MMRFALNYRAAIDAITTDKTLKLRKYELFAEDWNIIQDLADILKQYKAATIHFSKNSASIAAVIPAMDKLTDSLKITASKPHHITIQAAMKLARAKMNRYYSLTNSSSAYRISMVLHPGMKLEYFCQHKWEDDWIEEAKNLVREEYISSYESKETASTATKPVSHLVKCRSTCMLIDTPSLSAKR
jgi:N-acetylmuramoyl-L-alanine amidase CwlA